MANAHVLFSIAVGGDKADLEALAKTFKFFEEFGGEIEHFIDQEFMDQGMMLSLERTEVFRDIDRNSDGAVNTDCSLEDADTDTPVCWIRSEESGNVDAVAAILQDWLIETKSDKAIPLQWAETCSRPIPDNFGGGAVWITAEEIDLYSSHLWVHEKSRDTEPKTDDSPEMG